MRETEIRLRALMLAGLAGAPKAQEEFLSGVSRALKSYFRRCLAHSDPGAAEDLLQETLIAVHAKRETYDPAQPVTAWVFAIARYKMIDHFRRTQRRGVSIPVDDVAELFAEEQSDAGDHVRDVATLLAQLPEKQRTAIKLVKLDDLSVRDAAEQTGLSESDVKVSIHRGLKKLAALVSKGDQK